MVTQHDLADITDLEAGRKRIVDALPKGSPKITMTVLAIKACVAALKEFPHFNSSYDMNAGKLILKKYFHIGIAVDTERGLGGAGHPRRGQEEHPRPRRRGGGARGEGPRPAS